MNIRDRKSFSKAEVYLINQTADHLEGRTFSNLKAKPFNTGCAAIVDKIGFRQTYIGLGAPTLISFGFDGDLTFLLKTSADEKLPR